MVAAIFGNPNLETEFLLNKFNIRRLPDATELIENASEIVLVDASDLIGISKKINPEKVVEVIDHRKQYEPSDFPNAGFEVVLVRLLL